MSKSFDRFKQGLMASAKKHGTESDVLVCANILNQTAKFLAGNGLCGDSMASLEMLGSDSIPKLNTTLIGNNELSCDALMDFVVACKVPDAHRITVATECARILDGKISQSTHFQNVELNQRDHISLESYAGAGVARQIARDNDRALEAFGGDIDRLAQDNRMSIVMAVMRPFTSVIDKVFPRIAEESNVVTVSIPAPEVYDLALSMNASSAVRNAATTRTPLVNLYKTPGVVSTQPKQIIASKANDTGAVPAVYDATGAAVFAGALNVSVPANLFDLTLNSSAIGFNAIDYTDLVAEGGRIDTLFVQVSQTNGGTTTTEVFSVPVQYLPSAVFVPSPNNDDSAEMIANVRVATMLRSTSVQSVGTTTQILSGFTDGAIQLDITLNAQLNLKTANITGSGAVNATLKPKAGLTAPSAATQTSYGQLSFKVVAYFPELYFDEENMRKTTTAIRVNYLEKQFVIPMGRNFVVDYALQQGDDSAVASTINKVVALGNSARGLAIMQSRLKDTASALTFMAANPELASLVQPARQSFAATLCIPYVVSTSIDFSDAKTAVMRESERLSDMHARLRETLLNALATMCSQSLYLNNLEAGEKPVFRAVTYSTVADLIFGIIDYHNTLNDVVTTATGVDDSFELPNGYRIDVVKTTFLDYQNSVMVVPIREASPSDITSFGTIRDRGSYVAQYTPINNGGVARRVVTNSREILFPTNSVGCLLNILNLSSELGSVGPNSL